MDWNRNVAIVGIGRTKAGSRRHDVNQNEMIAEAIKEALEDAKLSPKDIDFNLIGDMELFQGDYAGDMWQLPGFGQRPGMRMTTGGTTGGMLVSSAAYFIASEMHDIVMIVGFQKHDEGNATSGLASCTDPLWEGWFMGGFGGLLAQQFVEKYGARIETTAAKVRSILSESASGNPYAHLRQRYSVDDVMASPMLNYPQRVMHLCPQSNGACAIILACEEKAKKITNKPVWIKDFTTAHTAGWTTGETANLDQDSTWAYAARKLFKRNHITDPLKQIDLLELYNPTVWTTMQQIEGILGITGEEVIEMIDRGDIGLDGAMPVSPSGGVLCTNPIGAAAMLRVAEAALQVRGDCGDYQVKKDVNTALASSFGGNNWIILHLLTKNLEQ